MSITQQVAQVRGRLELKGIEPEQVNVQGYEGVGGWYLIVVKPGMAVLLDPDPEMAGAVLLDRVSVALLETRQPGEMGRTASSVIVHIGPAPYPGVASTLAPS